MIISYDHNVCKRTIVVGKRGTAGLSSQKHYCSARPKQLAKEQNLKSVYTPATYPPPPPTQTFRALPDDLGH